jgi:cell division protein FtsB
VGGRGRSRAHGQQAARSASRPATARRAAAGGAAKRTSAPQPGRLTGRATVLLVIFVALALAYTYPVRVLLGQQADIARMEAAQADQSDHIDDLTLQVAKWQDDEYVRIQARRRLFYVYPGEIPLVVLTPRPADEGGAADGGAGRSPHGPPWYDKLWSSIRAADERPG